MDHLCRYDSPLGEITLASDGEAIVGLWFEGQKHFAATVSEKTTSGTSAVFDEAARWLDAYFAGHEPDETPPLRLRGTDFQKAVWIALLEIPFGETTTYGALAERLGLGRGGARAVGAAVGRNPISIMVPCHRVLGSDGSLTGYAGGVERKRKLLELERKRA